MLTQKQKLHLEHERWWLMGTGLVLVALLAFAADYYGPRILPGVKVGQVHVGGMRPIDALHKVQTELADRQLRITVDGRDWTKTYAELGINIDAARSVVDAFAIGRSAPLADWWKVAVSRQPIALTYAWSDEQLDAQLRQIVDQSKRLPQEPSVVYRDDAFQLLPGEAGYVINADEVQRAADDVIAFDQPMLISTTLTYQEPSVTGDDFQPAIDAAMALISQPLLLIANGATFEINRATQANWLTFETTRSSNRPVMIVANKAAIGSYLLSLAKQVNVPTQPREVLVSENKTDVLHEGTAGLLLDIDPSVSLVSDALTGRFRSEVTLPIREEEPNVQLASTPSAPTSSGKVIAVDVTKQWEYVYEDNVLVYSSPVSTGINDWTPTGTFHVYGKTKKQKMSGPDYYVPNVPDILWFKGDYSIHGVYWHNDFGIRPRSHGCVGMPLDAAAWLFDWADVGTTVYIYKSSQTPAPAVS